MFEKQAHLPSPNDDRRASNWALPHTDGSVTTDALLQGVDPRQACHRDGPRSDLRQAPENSHRGGGVVKRADRTRTTIFSHRAATNLAAHLAAKVDAGRLTGADLFFLAFKASRY